MTKTRLLRVGLILAVIPAIALADFILKDEGVKKGRARDIDCVGSGVTCSVDGGIARVSVVSPDAGAGTGTCAAGKYVSEVTTSGPVCTDLPGADNLRYTWDDLASQQTLTKSAYTSVNYDTSEYNASNDLTITTTPFRIEAKIDAVYHLDAAVRVDTGGANGSTVAKFVLRRLPFGLEAWEDYVILDIDDRDDTSDRLHHYQGSTDFKVNSGDKFELAIYCDAAKDWATFAAATDTWVSVHRVH